MPTIVAADNLMNVSISAWKFLVLAAALVAQSACDRRTDRALIAVTFANRDAVRLAQETIAETAAEGDPVIILRRVSRGGDALTKAFSQAEWVLSQPGVVAVVGHESSGSSLAAAPAYHDAGIPLVVPTATSPLLHDLPGVFPLPVDDSIQGAFMVRFAADSLAARSATVFYANDVYGYGLRKAVAQECRRAGVAITQEIPLTRSSDIASLVASAFEEAMTDVVIAASRFPEVWLLARELKRVGLAVPVIAGDGAYNSTPEIMRVAGSAADEVYFSMYWDPRLADSVGRSFIDRFRLVAGRAPGPVDAMVYDAIMVVVAAIHGAGPSRAAVTLYLDELGYIRPPYQGVTGPIQFHDRLARPLVMMHSQGGAPRIVARW